MRLLHTKDLTLREFIASPPAYAIVSHTWEEDEVLFSDIANLYQARTKAGFAKVQQACRRALCDELEWIWIDTCCIDKSSSAELSEALNSMFQWYKGSAVCYAYISDMLPDEDLSHGLKKSRWVTRGWTLQELIAPKELWFLDRDWHKRDGDGGICDIAQIDSDVLQGRRPLSSVPVCHRMAWAASRVTTRIEDRAYSLLGIFEVNMPMLYGEGDRAFIRLQHEIIKATNDLTIFAWIPRGPTFRGQVPFPGIELLAHGPEVFTCRLPLKRLPGALSSSEFSVTNTGIKIADKLRLHPATLDGQRFYFLRLGYHIQDKSKIWLGVDLYQCGPNLFARVPRPTLSRLEFAAARDQATETIAMFLQHQPPTLEPTYIVADQRLLMAQWTRKGSFHFKFSSAFEELFAPDDVMAQPKAHYDRANHLFVTLKRPGFVGLLRLPQSHVFPHHEPISIICAQSFGSKLWCAVGKGTDPIVNGYSNPITQMLDRIFLGNEDNSALRTNVVVLARNGLDEWHEITVSISIEPGTFPGLGDEPVAQVHVVHVTAEWSAARGKLDAGR
ncbi:HET-domain-containing protein [Apiospora arundinis]|uniref:HET-domain-containing protein n=1 Tax=Apiospora arundinis TaxID=335852 RepID=A0ABR2I9N7_9PEZI